MKRWAAVSERLRRARGALSQRALARELGVSQQNVQRFERGRAPSAAFLIAWGKSGRSVEWLLFGSKRSSSLGRMPTERRAARRTPTLRLFPVPDTVAAR